MSTTRFALRRLALALLVTSAAACGDDAMTAFPEEDASDQDGPSFDLPATDNGAVDTGTTDRGTATDTPVIRDRGASETTICPASCAASAECDPCRTDDTPSTVQYCCISGLCVSMTGMCPAGGDGGIGGDAASDAANDGAADAPSFDDVPDPGDTGDEPDADPPPDDVGPASDLGGDATPGADGSADAGADAGAAMDAAMDAASSG